MNLNSSPSPFPIQHQIISNDNDQQYFGPNPSSVSCHIFFNNSTQDHMGFYDHHPKLYQPQHISDDNNHGGSTYEIKNTKVDQSGLKLTLWKKEEDYGHEENTPQNINNNPVKWMSSKMRLMQKMKKTPDRVTLKITNSSAKNKLEDQKEHQIKPSSSLETDLSSNNSSYINNSPIRVCSDCNTTKTPLWRSGPKGPKSLCNACGIRQRKARRAMAAAAAAAANGTADQPPATLKIKVHHKEKMGKNENASHLKKRLKTTFNGAISEAGSSSNGQKKLGNFEDLLINLSKNLSFHRVFPEDERDAAILLMALSSGLVHG